MKAATVTSLTLTNFRNYPKLKISFGTTPVVFTGANGAGKTNILEAISFLSPGRGLRSIKLKTADYLADASNYNPDANNQAPSTPWVVNADVAYGALDTNIATTRSINLNSNKRIVKIDGNLVRSQMQLANYFSILWLTPEMDGLFAAPARERRRFVDRLVYNFYPEHADLVNAYEYLVRERLKLLLRAAENSHYLNKNWLASLEAKIAEKSCAIATSRVEVMNFIEDAILDSSHSVLNVFPKAKVKMVGEVENLIGSTTSLALEDFIREKLLLNREKDAKTKRTNFGVHKSDLEVLHIEKNTIAGLCSTGEQKALLIRIILALAKAKSLVKTEKPLMLLDDILSHLDKNRQQALFTELLDLKTQFFLTGTNKDDFAMLGGSAQFFEVSGGAVEHG